MGAKLHEKQNDGSIPSSEMKDGDVGVVVDWPPRGDSYRGQVVQRFGDHLVAIGRPWGNSWHSWFRGTATECPQCRVRLLPPGTLIELTDESNG